MKTSRPPTLATWLLEGSGAKPALIGDLVEEFGHGDRSQTWLWKQVLNIVLREFFSSNIHAFRWFVALPFAMLAVYAEARLLTHIWVRALIWSFGWRWNAVVVDAAMFVMAFVMAATFVITGVWAAPSRKDSVARIALSVVVVFGALVANLPQFFGDPFNARVVATGVCILLGGVAGYVSPGLQSKTRPT